MKLKIIKSSQVILPKSDIKKVALANNYLTNKYHVRTADLTQKEVAKKPLRNEIINYLLRKIDRDTSYLEIGVRHTEENFDLIKASNKYSVDPGYESEINNVDYKITSDEFFQQVKNGEILQKDIKFDVVFIDGSHLADQVARDINNSLTHLQDDGFIVMHDCNPPSEFHASENYDYRLSPASGYWNGTTWKAFFNVRKRKDIFSCCIDTDWGIGIISKIKNLGKATTVNNEFYEYHILDKNRKESLNLISFEDFKNCF